MRRSSPRMPSPCRCVVASRGAHLETYKFTIAGLSGYLTTGELQDGSLGEVFVRVSKQGSTLSGIMDGLAMSVSVGLQYGCRWRPSSPSM